MSELSLFMRGIKKPSNGENKLERKIENNYSVSKIVKTRWIDKKTILKPKFTKINRE